MKGVLFLSVVCAAVGSASLASDFTWGVNGHPITAYPGTSIDEQLDLIEELGMTSYRVNISHPEEGDALAPVVAAAVARGIDILPVLTPGVDLDAQTPDSLREDAREFAFGLASRFGDDIRIWELGNEMEIYAIIRACEQRDDGTIYPCEWGPAGGVSSLDYYTPRWEKVSAVLGGLSEGIRDADPDLVTAMGVAGWGHVGAFERMRDDGLDWDISVWHLYGQDPEWAFEILAEYDRPIWVTEVNHPYGSRDGEEAQAEGLQQMMMRLVELSERYRVEAVHIYQLLDEPYWAPSFEAVMGLVTMEPSSEDTWTPDARKPAFHAVADAIAALTPASNCEAEAIAAIPDPEVRQADVAHCLFLGRSPTPLERMEWRAAGLRDDAGTGPLVADLLRAPEFGATLLEALTEAEFVSLVYRRLLEREPDGQGLAAYAGMLSEGSIRRHDLLMATIASSEFQTLHPELFAAGPPEDCGTRAAQADRIAVPYCLILERPPSAEEHARWSELLDNDADGETRLLDALVGSSEFAEHHRIGALSDEEYVGLIYRVMLGREPDGRGRADYGSQLASGAMSRMTLARAMARSAEFAARRTALSAGASQTAAAVARDCDLAAEAARADAHARQAAYSHCLILGEPVDPEDLRRWSAELAEGTLRPVDLIEALAASERFAERRQTEALSDEDYVDLVYRVILLREPDGGGRSSFLNRLSRGELRREDITVAAIRSPEFKARHAALAE